MNLTSSSLLAILGNPSYVWKMSSIRRAPLRRTITLGLLSLCLVIASLRIDQTAHSRSEARDLGFGYPLHFAFSDFSDYYYPFAYPQTFRLNPWEVPVKGNPLTFLVSWLLVYGVVLASWVLLRTALTSVRQFVFVSRRQA